MGSSWPYQVLQAETGLFYPAWLRPGFPHTATTIYLRMSSGPDNGASFFLTSAINLFMFCSCLPTPLFPQPTASS